MSLNKSAIITGLALVGLILSSPGCEGPATYVLPEGSPPTGGEPVPSALTAFLSSNRPRLIRDDAREGSAVLTVTSSRESTFTWIIDAPDGLLDVCVGPADDCIPLPDDGTDPSTGIRGWLRIRDVLSDPGPTGAEVRITVIVTEVLDPTDDGEAEIEPESTEEEVLLTVVRPESELAVSISSGSGRIAPHSTVVLIASVSGGSPFVGGSTCGTAVEDNEFNPPDSDPPYCITWTVDESGLIMDGRGGGTFNLNALTTGENGETLSGVTYVAPLAVGNVSFRVDVTDERGNRSTSTLAIPVTSERELAIAEGTAASIDVAPGRSVELSATASGGEAPYTITFELLGGDDAIGTLASTPAVCRDLTEGERCTADYVAPEDKVGPVQVRVTIEDAVGATSSTIIPLTVDSPEPLTVDFNTPSAVQPNSTTQIRADVSGGTPPYTVCFGFQDTALGTIEIKSGDCSPDPDNEYLDGLTLCTCDVGDLSTDGLVTETVERNYKAPGDDGDVRLEVRVTDATGANASATEGVNISPSAGGSGTGGTGPVGIGASAVNPTLCLGDSTNINATAIPGTAPYTFQWVQTGGTPCPGALPDVNTASNTFTPCQGGQFQVKVIVKDAAETQAETTVNVFAVDPLAQLPAGCNDNNSCTQDTCGGGVCTNTPLTGPACIDGDPCTTGDVCTAGVCAGTAIDCSDNNECTTDSCAGGQCINQDLPDGAACDDGVFCTLTDACDDGECIGTGTPCPGQQCIEGTQACVDCQNNPDCDDGDVCTDDTCNAGVCVHANNTDACDDGLFCNGADTCSGGACTGHAGDPCGGGTPFCDENTDACVECLVAGDCDDTNGCTDDSCAAGLCFNVPNNDACDDALFCNGTDTCSGGTCSVHSGSPCGAQACDEAGDACVDCLLDVDCDDAEVCTDDACVVGVCQYTNNIDGCDDGIFCNGADTCSGGSCSDHAGDPCGGGTPFCDEAISSCVACLVDVDCDDTNVCTTDICNASGVCVYVENSAPCNDLLFCNGADTCSGGACSLHAGTPCGGATPVCDEGTDSCLACIVDGDCDDGNACTDDACIAGACDYTNNTDACDDGDACTTGDVCSAGACAGTAIDCDDVNECTNDFCIGGVCNHSNVANNTPCEDGEFCTDGDKCTGGSCNPGNSDPCGGGTPFCDEVGDVCVECLVDGDCDDTLYCNGVESCAGGSCQGGAPVDCDDALDCTTDSCNEGGDICDNTLNAGSCLIGGVCFTDGQLNPGNDCEVCDSVSDPTGWSNVAAATACGDPSDTDCTDPDTCDGAGTCDPNHEPDGTPCTDCGTPPCSTCLAGVCQET